MTIRSGKCILKTAAILLMTAAFSMSAERMPAVHIVSYAAEDSDYAIGSADWEYDDATGRVRAVWDAPEEKTSYVLRVYRGSVNLNKNGLYTNTIKAQNAYHDFSRTIAKYGSGTYYYTVYPKKVSAEAREAYTVISGSFEVDSDMLSLIRKYTNYSSSSSSSSSVTTGFNLETKLGWTMLPDGTWKYRLSKTSFAKNQWLKVNGKWYYFGADSIMLTGWQNIGGKYFYFNSDGDLWTGGTSGSGSSSGSTATASSQVIAGSVQTSERTASADNTAANAYTGRTQSLSGLTISFTETETDPGKVRPMTVSAPSNVEISDLSYSIPQANWTVGAKVSVSMTVKATGNYQFGNGMKVYGSNATFKSQSGDAFTRTLRFEYIPKTRLARPQKIYLDGDTVIKWTKVSGASKYSVKIVYDEEYTYNPESDSSDMTIYIDEGEDETRYHGRTRTVTVNQNQIDVSDYVGIDELINVKFYISAVASSSRSDHYLSSEAVEFTAEQGQTASSTDTGSVTSNRNGDMVFLDSNGSYITGWQDLNGAWYYFSSNGAAVGPGWKQIDKRWYYFDAEHKMCTGWVQVGDYWYYLNEGSSDTYGAMLTGSHEINGTVYYLNENESNGTPLGAWVQ